MIGLGFANVEELFMVNVEAKPCFYGLSSIATEQSQYMILGVEDSAKLDS